MPGSSITSPLSVIDDALLKLFTCGKTADSETHLTHLFDSVDETTIPLLTQTAIQSGSLPANSLVRYRCLVQDMLDIEYYSSIFKTKNGKLLFSKYRDRITSSSSVGGTDIAQMYDELEEMGVNGERIPLVCVPVPGENEWVHSYDRHSDTPPSSTNSDDYHVSHTDSVQEGEDFRSKKRKTVGVVDTAELKNRTCCLLKIYDNLSTVSSLSSSSTPTTSGQEPASATASPRPVRLNDMLEVIGIYTPDDTHELLGTSIPPPSAAVSSSSSISCINSSLLCGDTRFAGFEELLLQEEQEDMGLEDMELEGVPADVRQERMYPSRLFPRVHCVRFRVLPSSYPLFTSAAATPSRQVVHTQVVEALRTVLLGDHLAAEYAALMLISRAGLNSAQQNKVTVEGQDFGNLCLNLCQTMSNNVEADIRISRLSSFLQELLPRSRVVEVNINSLNTNTLFMSKQVGGRGTEQSMLQLGVGTTLLLDESDMGEGELQGRALKNIRALKGVLNDQRLLVECSYYDIYIPTDVSVIIFSKASSILSTSATIHLPLDALPNSIFSTPMDVDDNVGENDVLFPHMSVMRQWWAESRDLPKPSMDEAVVQAAERDFLLATAAANREGGDVERGGGVTSCVLHRWILTAQLVALAEGASSVSLAHWGKMQDMERQLRARRSRPSTC